MAVQRMPWTGSFVSRTRFDFSSSPAAYHACSPITGGLLRVAVCSGSDEPHQVRCPRMLSPPPSGFCCQHREACLQGTEVDPLWKKLQAGIFDPLIAKVRSPRSFLTCCCLLNILELNVCVVARLGSAAERAAAHHMAAVCFYSYSASRSVPCNGYGATNSAAL
jgi:hypothetical protein